MEAELQVLVVVHQSALHFHGLHDGLSGLEVILQSLGQGCTVNKQFRAVWVALVHEREVEEHAAACPAVGYLAGVTQFDIEYRTLIGQYVGLLVGIDAHGGFGDEQGGVVERRTRVEVAGLILVLVHAVGGTGLGEEDITAVFLRGRDLRTEVVNGIGYRIVPYRVHRRAVNGHGNLALVVRHDAEAGALMVADIRTFAGI